MLIIVNNENKKCWNQEISELKARISIMYMYILYKYLPYLPTFTNFGYYTTMKFFFERPRGIL